MGVSESGGNIINEGDVYGTYIHGIFDKEEIAGEIVQSLMKKRGLDPSDVKAFDIEEYKQSQYDLLSRGLRRPWTWISFTA